MDDPAAQLGEVAQQLAVLAALAKKLAEYPVFDRTDHANDDHPVDPASEEPGHHMQHLQHQGLWYCRSYRQKVSPRQTHLGGTGAA